jgi:hypothetical protein
MATTSTLDYAKQELDRSAKRGEQAAEEVKAAGKAFADAQAAAKLDRDGLAQAEKRRSAALKALGAISTPADAAPLLEDFKLAAARNQAAQGALLDHSRFVAKAEARYKSAVAEAAAAQAQKARVEKRVPEAEAAEKKRNDLIDKVKAAPLKDIPVDAATLRNGPLYKAAENRLKEDFTPDFFSYAQSRRIAEKARIEKTRGPALAAAAELDKAATVLAKAEVKLEDAAANFDTYWSAAPARLAIAEALLKKVADPATISISEGQRTSIAAAPPLTAILAKEKTRDTALNSLIGAELALENSKIAALTNPAENTTQKETAVTTARTAFEAANKAWLPDWKEIEELLAVRDDKYEALLKERKEAGLSAALSVTGGTGAGTGGAGTGGAGTGGAGTGGAGTGGAGTGGAGTTKTKVEVAEEEYASSVKALDDERAKTIDYFALHTFENSIPDAAWRLFADLMRATDILDELGSAKPSDLIDNVLKADKDYATALEAADKAARKAAALKTLLGTNEADADRRNEQAGDSLFAALRGDR